MKYFLILSLFLCSGAFAVTYEDSEDKGTKGWKLYNDTSTSTIKNIYDEARGSRVISLKGKDTQNGYMFALERDSVAWSKTEGKRIKWSMSSTEHFVIFISLQTRNGHRTLIYTSGSQDGKGYYSLGEQATNGKWHTFNRDLDKDFKKYEPSNEIIAVDTFFVRGNIRIDDIKILDSHKKVTIKKVTTKPKESQLSTVAVAPQVIEPKIEVIVKKNTATTIDNVPPVITLHGHETVILNLGEPYHEKGATAIDDQDGELPVEMSDTVDINRVGIYTLFYIAKDKANNTSITTRIVNVGSRPKKNSRKPSMVKHATNLESERLPYQDLDVPPEIDFPPEEEALIEGINFD